MTNEEIDKLNAGAMLDAMVAERVMGWSPMFPPGERPTGWHGGGGVDERGQPFVHLISSKWSPSTDIAAAWELLNAWEGDYEVRRQNDQHRVELFRPSEEFQAWAVTLPLAICHARLKAANAKASTPCP